MEHNVGIFGFLVRRVWCSGTVFVQTPKWQLFNAAINVKKAIFRRKMGINQKSGGIILATSTASWSKRDGETESARLHDSNNLTWFVTLKPKIWCNHLQIFFNFFVDRRNPNGANILTSVFNYYLKKKKQKPTQNLYKTFFIVRFFFTFPRGLSDNNDNNVWFNNKWNLK